jgi:hypothetical protein
MAGEAAQQAWLSIERCGRFVTGSRFDDAVPDRVPHELTHRVEMELGQDVRSVCFRGLGGHPE